jgi:putative tricarboxylic transport membrane protein
MRKGLTADRAAGIVFMLLGMMALLEGWRLLSLRSRGMAGDDAFPLLLGLVMVVLGAALAFFVKPQKRSVSWPGRKQAWVMLEGALVLAAFWILLPFLGFAISSFFAAAGLFSTIGGFRWRGCLLASGILTAAFYAIFVAWLGMPFPVGLFGI